MLAQMQIGFHLAPAEAAAAALLLAAWIGVGLLVEHPPRARPSVTRLMEAHRRAWMREMVTRNTRIFDGTIIDSLRQGSAFFASASLISLGGCLALMGEADRLETVAQDLTLPVMGAPVEAKLMLPILFLAAAMMSFLWAHRLFGYCAIMMAAVPNDPADPAAHPAAERAAEVNISAARHFNRGLRSIYFALAALAALAGPVPLALATATAAAIQLRREFASGSRLVMSAGTDRPPPPTV